MKILGIKNDRKIKKGKKYDDTSIAEYLKILEIKAKNDKAIKQQQKQLDKENKKEKQKIAKNTENNKETENQIIEQIKEERQQFKENLKEAASQFDKKTENHYEIIAAQDAVLKRQIDYLKAAYKLQEEQADERDF